MLFLNYRWILYFCGIFCMVNDSCLDFNLIYFWEDDYKMENVCCIYLIYQCNFVFYRCVSQCGCFKFYFQVVNILDFIDFQEVI